MIKGELIISWCLKNDIFVLKFIPVKEKFNEEIHIIVYALVYVDCKFNPPPPDMTCAGEIPFFMVHMTGKKHARGRRRGVRYKVSVVIWFSAVPVHCSVWVFK